MDGIYSLLTYPGSAMHSDSAREDFDIVEFRSGKVTIGVVFRGDETLFATGDIFSVIPKGDFDIKDCSIPVDITDDEVYSDTVSLMTQDCVLRFLNKNTGHKNFELLSNLVKKKILNLKTIRYEDDYVQQPKRVDIPDDISCVYFIGSGDFVKIGRTIGLKSRLQSIQTGSPLELDVIHYIATEQPELHERELHRVLSVCRHRGEWFQLPDELIEIIKSSDNCDSLIANIASVKLPQNFKTNVTSFTDLKDQLEIVQFASKNLDLSDSAKIMMLAELCKSKGIEADFLKPLAYTHS